MDAGYFSLELQELSLKLQEAPSDELKLRVDVALETAFDVIKWANLETNTFQTSEMTPVRTGENEDDSSYILGFDQLIVKSGYVDLNKDVVTSLANSVVRVKVFSIREIPAPDPAAMKAAKPAKGAPPPPEIPAEELLAEIAINVWSVFGTAECSISISEVMSDISIPGVVVSFNEKKIFGDSSNLSLKLFTDNEMAEYLLGSRVLMWNSAALVSPPAIWGLHAPDVVDPKAKKQPTVEELRQKYLDNIAALIENQANIVQYTLSVGSEPSKTEKDREETDETAEGKNGADEQEPMDAAMKESQAIMELLPVLSLAPGKIAFNTEKAGLITVEDDIRAIGDLWSITWSSSPVIFLHRTEAKKLADIIQKDPEHAYLPLTMKKIPAADYLTVEGGESFATAVIDLKQIITPGAISSTLGASLRGDMMEDAKPTFSLTFFANAPLVPKSAIELLNEKKALNPQTSSITRPADVISGVQAAMGDPNRNAIAELRGEISKTIERIAQEYLSLFPANSAGSRSPSRRGSPTNEPMSNQSVSGENGTATMSKEERKAEFLGFMKSNGIFHELRENLKPRVQLIIRERYGARGRALGRSDILKAIDSGEEEADASSDETIDAVLNELYVFLLKECSAVLNSVFSDTVIDRDQYEVEKAGCLNDEEETPGQIFDRLLRQAGDAFADSRFAAAEKYHLERIQMVSNVITLGSDAYTVQEAYCEYGKMLLHQAAATLQSAQAVASKTDGEMDLQAKVNELVQKAREALAVAYSADESPWSVGLLYAGILVEVDQHTQAEAVLQKVLASQLRYRAKEDNAFHMGSFKEFDGYESDKLCPIDPKCYGFLSALFNMQGLPIKARKALRMANRSFVDGEFKPDVSTHGSPKRTTVLILAETAVYMFTHCLTKLGQSCVQLATMCDEAVEDKARARGMASQKVAHIRHLMRTAEALSLMMPADAANNALAGEGDQAQPPSAAVALSMSVDKAKESTFAAESTEDKIRAWLTVARAQSSAKVDIPAIIESYLSAVHFSSELSLEVLQTQNILPLQAMVTAGKLMINCSRYTDALSMLLYCCAVYNSSALLLLVGICCMRIDQLEDAEDALLEANLLDNTVPEVWAYLSLMCLTAGKHRVDEALEALAQALRLGLCNASLLRELATSFMAVDKLQTAEDLIRRALTNETSVDGTKKPSPYTRKLLADVLSSQGSAAKSVEEFRAVIGDPSLDTRARMDAARKCAELLNSLGREEELRVLSDIIASIQISQ